MKTFKIDSKSEGREHGRRGEGCDLFPSCLDCSLPNCRYDEAGGAQRRIRNLRDREVLKLHHSGGMSIKELANRFDLSKRTVYRIIRRIVDE